MLIGFYGMRIGSLLSWEFDLCRNGGALPYDDKVTFLSEKCCDLMVLRPW